MLSLHLSHYAYPLMYIQWFRPFHGPEPHSGLYTTSHSTSNKMHCHSIVSASLLICSCHLTPKYSVEDVDADWTSDSILDECTDFFLNTYIGFHMFHKLAFPAGI